VGVLCPGDRAACNSFATPFPVEFTAKDRRLLKTDNWAVNTVKCDEAYDGEGYTTYYKNTD